MPMVVAAAYLREEVLRLVALAASASSPAARDAFGRLASTYNDRAGRMEQRSRQAQPVPKAAEK